MEKNILSIDLGKHTCGLAISRTGILSSPLSPFTISNLDYSPLIDYLIKLSKVEKIETIVIGYPLYPSGDKCEMTSIVEKFKEDLEKVFTNIKIEFQDERDSTLQASEFLHLQGKNSKKQKQYIDSASACVILDRYINRVNN